MLVVVQGTGFCNIDCSYCYLPGRTHKKRIGLDTIQQLVTQLIALEAASRKAEITIVWHAGEPLILPIHFYERAFDEFRRLARNGTKISHGFQTNGTLIDDAWLDFFLRHRPSIGVSIDGPEAVHNQYRKYRNGSGSWDRCMSGIRRLQDYNIPFHTISVLTEAALKQPDQMFEFFCSNKLYNIGFNIEEVEGANLHSSLQQIDYEKLYGRFLRRFLQRNRNEGHPLRIREAENTAAALLAKELPFNAQTELGQIISVDVDGNVATFSPELLGMTNYTFHNFIIGNIWDEGIAEMLAGQVSRRIADEIAIGVENCRNTCDLFAFCKGGAPVNKISETGTFRSTETMYCRLTVKSTIRECVDFLLNSTPIQDVQLERPR